MDIQDMLSFYGYNGVDIFALSEEQQLQMWNLFAYWTERSDDIRHTNCTTAEQDILLRRRDKVVYRGIEDVLDGDYGHC